MKISNTGVPGIAQHVVCYLLEVHNWRYCCSHCFRRGGEKEEHIANVDRVPCGALRFGTGCQPAGAPVEMKYYKKLFLGSFQAFVPTVLRPRK